MKNFFRRLGDILTTLRVWLVNLVTLGVLAYIVFVVIMVVRQMPETEDPEGKVLILAPDGVILDQQVFPSDIRFPFQDIPDYNQIHVRDLTRIIRTAAEDERLAGVLLDFSKAKFSGTSTALLIADELAALRESGKPVIAYSSRLTTASYLMAAQAEEVYVHPSGAVSIAGLGGYRQYTRELSEKLKITMHNYSQGDFKSAVESRTRNDMSEADKMQRRELLEPMWAAVKQRMAEPRGLEPAVFQEYADDYQVPVLQEAAYDNLAWAQSQGIIDGTKSYPAFRQYMIERFGRDESSKRETYPHIGGGAYLAQIEPEQEKAGEAVAVVFVQGAIQTGKQAPGVAGADDIANLIRRAHEKDSTRALVLRVNSPGGSIIASDMIRDELLAAQRKNLPVVVSMGDVAASGGMWVSTPADAIFAQPTTITGSIGVALALPTFENSLDYLGIHFDGVTTSEHAGWNVYRPMNEDVDAILGRWAGSAYERFVSIVAESRDKETEYIRAIAGGRIWSGERAAELGLVDELGTLEDAVLDAAGRAGLGEYRVDYVVKGMPPGYNLLRRLAPQLAISDLSPYGQFGQQVARLMELFNGISEPTPAVICAECMVEFP